MKKSLILFGILLAPSSLRLEAASPPDCPTLCKTYETQKNESSQPDIQSLFLTLGPHCEALSFLGLSKPLQITSTSLYAAAAASCLTACALQPTPVGPIAVAVCTILGGSSTLFDLSSTIAITVKGESAWEWWSSHMGSSWGGLVAGAAGGAAAGVSGALQSGKTLGKVGQWTNARASSCVAGALFTVGAMVKGTQIQTLSTLEQKECSIVQATSSQIATALASFNPQNSSLPSFPSGGGGGPSLGGGFSTTNLSPQGGGFGITPFSQTGPSLLSFSSSGFPAQGSFAQAFQEAPLGSLLQKMPQVSELPNFLSSLGNSLETLSERLQDPSNSVASLLPELLPSGWQDAGQPSLSQLSPTLQELQQLSQSGQIQGFASSPASLSEQGERPSLSAANALGTPPPSEISFPRKGGERPGSHSSATAQASALGGAAALQGIVTQSSSETLFQLLSKALQRLSPSLSQVPWEGRFNRATRGLPLASFF